MNEGSTAVSTQITICPMTDRSCAAPASRLLNGSDQTCTISSDRCQTILRQNMTHPIYHRVPVFFEVFYNPHLRLSGRRESTVSQPGTDYCEGVVPWRMKL